MTLANLQQIAHQLNEVRQLIALVKLRPAVKKTGERGTLIAYSELTVIERKLNLVFNALSSDATDHVEQGEDLALNAYPRPMGAPAVDEYMVAKITAGAAKGCFRIWKGNDALDLVESFGAVLKWFAARELPYDFACNNFSLHDPEIREVWENET